MLLVTHYERLLELIVPDRVHVLADGRIVKSGGKELARELDERGYDWLQAEARAARDVTTLKQALGRAAGRLTRLGRVASRARGALDRARRPRACRRRGARTGAIRT